MFRHLHSNSVASFLDASFQEIRNPGFPKGPNFVLFSDFPFWLAKPKVFLKALLAPIYTNFEWGERAKYA